LSILLYTRVDSIDSAWHADLLAKSHYIHTARNYTEYNLFAGIRKNGDEVTP